MTYNEAYDILWHVREFNSELTAEEREACTMLMHCYNRNAAKWLTLKDGTMFCSNCHNKRSSKHKKYSYYCGHCGCKMDLSTLNGGPEDEQ